MLFAHIFRVWKGYRGKIGQILRLASDLFDFPIGQARIKRLQKFNLGKCHAGEIARKISGQILEFCHFALVQMATKENGLVIFTTGGDNDFLHAVILGEDG